MNQEKFGKFIKEIRKKNNLTQKEFADKYHVTYQAVSKWENAQNLPDTSLIKQMSKDFGISMEELLDGKYHKKKKRYLIIFISLIIIIGLVLLIIFKLFPKDNDFHFKILSTTCNNFNISGNISYNEKKSAIYITNIEYCGGDDTEEYKSIECILYETNDNVEIKINSFKSKKEKIKLEEFLKDITFSINNYETTCKEYPENSFYLVINAIDYKDKITSYKIPLKLENCTN